MAGYTRQDTANNIANGNVIDADDFDAEYNQIESAFNASSGHVHDGTSGNGAPIEKVGPSQDLVITATKVEPKTTNTLDLGSSGVQFKDAFRRHRYPNSLWQWHCRWNLGCNWCFNCYGRCGRRYYR